jgi:hypothetical protein
LCTNALGTYQLRISNNEILVSRCRNALLDVHFPDVRDECMGYVLRYVDVHFPDVRDECVGYVLRYVEESRQYSKYLISVRPF